MFKKPGGCPHCGDKRVNKVKFADSANKKFPIDTPSNIKHSWDLLHKEKQLKKFSQFELKIMEEKIIDAWIKHIGFGVPNKTLD